MTDYSELKRLAMRYDIPDDVMGELEQLMTKKLKADNEALREDANRYRWLRDKAGAADWEYVGYQSPETTDSEIDQWMKERPNG